MSIWQRIKGGWKTWGPNAVLGDGAFASEDAYDACVTADTAMRLSAVQACMRLRAETIGTLPIHLRDAKKNVIQDHDLYGVLHHSPNSMMTAAEYWSLMTSHVDMYGNGLSLIQRNTSRKRIISLEPMDPTTASLVEPKRRGGSWLYRWPGGEEHPAEDILHLKGFSLDGLWGMSRLEAGRNILSAQINANDAALRAFRQGLKAGGFFKVEGPNLDPTQLDAFKKRLDFYGQSENAGKWMVLLKGMTPVGGADFRVKPVEAELLASRFFGIEEVCRLFNTPPQLIGHTDKSSSWASSIENINLFFLMYSLIPTLVRNEQSMVKRLLSPEDRGARIEPKTNIQGLLRGDMKAQKDFFVAGLQNGYFNVNEVRDLLDRANIEGGDEYRVQVNTAPVGQDDKEPEDRKP